MTKALDAAARAFYEAWVHNRDVPLPHWYQLKDVEPGALGKNVWRLGARAALRAALPAEPTPEAMEALIGALYEWQDRDMLGDAWRAYRALRAHLLGEAA